MYRKQLIPFSDFLSKIKIENIVASTFFGITLDLKSLGLRLEGADYNPERFPGLVYRIKDPKTATLIFHSGKAVCTGAKSLDDLNLAMRKVKGDLKEAGVDIKSELEITIQNIVASSDLGQDVNLRDVAMTLGLEKVEYEPEQFPGLVYRNEKPKVVLLIFSSGKLVCTGARTPQEVQTAVNMVIRDLRKGEMLS